MTTVQPSKSTRDEALRRKNARIADEFKGHCPPNRVKDLEGLVKEVKGDKTKIQERLMEWWDEPVHEEPEWNDVKRGSHKKPTSHSATPGSRRDMDNTSKEPRGPLSSRREGGGGRGFPRRGASEGGRGRGAERRSDTRGGRGRSSRSHSRPDASMQPADGYNTSSSSAQAISTQEEELGEAEEGAPSPVRVTPAPKGAWGKIPEPSAPAVQPQELPEPPEEEQVPQLPLTPAALTPVPAVHVPVISHSGNVWGSKGGAHLIMAEKKPPAPVMLPQAPALVAPAPRHKETEKRGRKSRHKPQPTEPVAPLPMAEPEEALPPAPPSPPQLPQVVDDICEPPAPVVPIPEPAIEDTLPPSVNGNNVNAAGWKPAPMPPQPDPVTEPMPLPQAPVVAPVKSPNTLKLGRWGTAEDHDNDHMDFDFGSFEGEQAASVPTTPEDDVSIEPAQEEPQAPPAAPAAPPAEPVAAVPPTSPSPARPPPGLSITNMPPMPAEATFVSELEGRLESAQLSVEAPSPDEGSAVEPPSTSPPVSAPAPVASAVSGALSPDIGSAPPPRVEVAPLPSGPTPPAPAAPAAPPSVVSGPLPSSGGFAPYGAAGAYAGYAAGGLGGGLPGAPAFGATAPHGSATVPVVAAKASQGGGLGGSAAGGTPGSGLQAAGQVSAGLYPGVVGAGADIGAVASAPVDAGVPAGVPPGINAGLYPNSMYYPQQYNYGAGVPAYPFGYNQYGMGSGMQAGYAYAQQIGQNGYAQYDDGQQHQQQQQQQHTQVQNHHQSGGGQYNKGGGYRRNNHHNNNHQNSNSYHNQYNPQQQQGYGQQTYNMGHYGDPFNRTGYGHAMNMDHYNMPTSGYPNSGPSVGGFGGDNEDGGGQYLKKKGGNRNGGRDFGGNPNMQFQSSQQQQQSQAPAQAPPNGPSFSLQGSMEGSNGASNGGWGGGPNWNAQMPSWQGA